MPNAWMIRAGRGGENVDAFLQHGIVAFGDTRIGELAPSICKDDLLRLFAENYPEEKKGSRASWASQLMRFLREMKPGDTAVTFDRERRLYLLGTITSDYEWAPGLIEDKPHVRRVKWTHQVLRDLLAVTTRNTLGGILTLFKLGGEVVRDLQAHRVSIGTAPPEIEPQAEQTAAAEQEVAKAEIRAEMIERADDFIEDAINRLDWEEMQELVAGILRSMGYRTSVSPRGADRGVDIFASPDGLGLQEPRIFVEVKHRQQATSAEQIRAFIGGRKPGDRCLYVSTGSFTKDARYEAERASVATTLLGLPQLRELLVENYEKLDAETRALVPLKRLYWPLA
jgi:restriction system protein